MDDDEVVDVGEVEATDVAVFGTSVGKEMLGANVDELGTVGVTKLKVNGGRVGSKYGFLVDG